MARHALGSLGWTTWFGSATVDVLATAGDTPVSPVRSAPGMTSYDRMGSVKDRGGFLPDTTVVPFVQPRAMVYRASTSTLLVAGEGNDVLAELDAHAAAPALAPLHTYALAGPKRRVDLYDFPTHGPKVPASACGAPSGVALSADEGTAYVYCRATDGLALVPLVDERIGPTVRPYRRNETYMVARLAESPLPEPEAEGRRLFYDATDPVVSGGLGCAGCHPEGRDDGFVWRELHADKDRQPSFVASASTLSSNEDPAAGKTLGRPRQTPMLAGRVNATGPYGWLAESPDLVRRIRGGFALHRWFPFPTDATTQKMRAEPLAAFLRKGLVPPPSQTGPLSEAEQRGKAIFESDISGCTRCHDPATEYKNNLALPLFGRRAKGPYDADPEPVFKVPSLYYVGATAPYYHDGSTATLEELIEQNRDHMGVTSHLTRADQRDLVAYLKRIEPPPGAPPAPVDAAAPWAPAMVEALPPDERGAEILPSPPAPKEGLRFYNADPWPTAPSAAPGKWEWAHVPEIALERQAAGCTARRIREYLRVHCAHDNHVTMQGGTRSEVSMAGTFEAEADVTIAVRPGDRRVFQISSQWKWLTPEVYLSEVWIEGERAPRITIDAIYSSGMQVVP
ncbi:MAG: hypothetical protein U0359_37805 [Byssovorax sp.]